MAQPARGHRSRILGVQVKPAAPWRALLFAGLALALALASAAAAANADLEEGMRHYENGDYAKAEHALRNASRAGEARAAEMLGFMYAFGPACYPGVAQDTRAALGQFDLAARGGRPAARYMVCALRRQARPPAGAREQCFDWVAETGQPGVRR